MALLGTLVKAGIEINSKISLGTEDPQRQQLNQLKKLLQAAEATAFGKFYGFKELLNSDDLIKKFKAEVPIFDYHQMNDAWWKQQLKYSDITWPGKPEFFALSSGTTGKKSKRIPITSDFLQSMKDVGSEQVKALANFDLPQSLFESDILMLSSSANLSKHDHGHLEGEISGINVSNFPGWYDLFYRPGIEIASIPDWDDRVKAIVKEAPNWNIGAIAGIPSWVVLLLKEIIAHHKLSTIHDLWPNLTAYASGGVAFDTYAKDFEMLTAKPLTIMDTYLASEGFFAFTARPDTMAMQLALNHGYFYEFIPFNDLGVDEQGNLLDDPVSLNLDEVVTDQEYVLIVSTCSGAWRYQIGDVIKFTSTDPYEIKITGRTKFFLNAVGSQLSEEKMDKAILEVSQDQSAVVSEYMVAALQNESGDYYHQWIIVSEDAIEEDHFKRALDESLKNSNKNYKIARNKALKDIKLRKISKAVYYNYLDAKKKKGGQVKTPKVMSSEKMVDFLERLEL
ncbi:MAG: GH3 auxin-responsive promoter family protein [Bacteroidota bacterium]